MLAQKQCQPAVSPSAEARSAPLRAAAPRPVGILPRQRILIVEDDETLRRLIRLILLSAGFEVLEAGRGAEALALSEAHAEPIHLLVTDLVLPGLDGHKLAGRLLEQRPDLRVLFISGNAEEITPREGRADFLQKPFTPNTFLASVNRLLGREDTPANHE